MNNLKRKIGAHWSNIAKKQRTEQNLKLRWWQSPHIIQHINRTVCDEAIPGVSNGLIQLLKIYASNSIPFEKGISVGCGSGLKEIKFVKLGLVESFDLYELSEARIASGKDLARKESLDDPIKRS